MHSGFAMKKTVFYCDIAVHLTRSRFKVDRYISQCEGEMESIYRK